MAATMRPTDTPPPPPRRRTATAGIARALSALLLLTLLLAALLYGGVRWLDSDAGHRFLVRQAPLYRPASGLTLRLGRIDGSIFDAAVLTDVRIGDPGGTFAEIPRLRIDWRPWDLITDRLTIHSLTAADVQLWRRPALRSSGDDRLLPDLDISIGRLRIGRLVLAPPVTGAARVLSLAARADIRAGRALVEVAARTIAGPAGTAAPTAGAAAPTAGGDTLILTLDSEPDRDRFDIAAVVKGPKDGALAALAGLPHAIDLTIDGDGRWTLWRGRLAARLDGLPVADLAVAARDGLFTITGDIRPTPWLVGAPARLLGPATRIDATARLAARRLQLAITAASPALIASARGSADFASERFGEFAISAQLRQPGAIAPKFRADGLRLDAKLAGSFVAPLAEWKLAARQIGWGATLASNVTAAGIAQPGPKDAATGTPLPITVRAARLTGLGADADALLTNIRIIGSLRLAGGGLVGERLVLRSDRLRATADARLFANGDVVANITGDLPGHDIAGLGNADVGARLRLVSDAGGLTLAGPVRVAVRRIDNATALRLLGGLPLLTADILLSDDLALLLRDARLAAPALTATLGGRRDGDGRLALTAAGASRDYGAFTLAVNGAAAAPTIDLTLARPGFGFVDVRAQVAPDGAAGPGRWRFAVDGVSDAGPVAARGTLRPAAPLGIDVVAVTLAGVTGTGTLTATDSGPLAGQLRFAGRGLAGTATLGAANGVQRIDIAASANDASFDLATPITIGSGELRLAVLLPAGGAEVRGNFSLADASRGGAILTSATGTIAYAGNQGSITARLEGESGAPFSLDTRADLGRDRISITAKGTVDGRDVTLAAPAVLNRVPAAGGIGAGWALAPVTIVTGEGNARLSGRFADHSEVHARLDHVSLALLGIPVPGLDLNGRLSGTLDIAVGADGVPSGSANLRVAGLSRAGVASSSLPVDVGLTAALGRPGIVARAIIARANRVIGRAQARIGPVPPGAAPLAKRLLTAPLAGQLRYAGPAQALWGLSGLDAFAVRGPVTVDAALGGVVGDPQLTGQLAARGARAELAILGAVVDQLTLDARFTGARLELTRFAGRAGPSGSVTGRGSVDLSATRGFPMDVRLQLTAAQLLKRDDATGTATGNVRIATDEFGGVVSGRLTVDRANYRLGRSAAADVPVLLVTEINTRALGRRASTYVPPTRWLLDLGIKGDRRLNVTGMGLAAEWQAEVRVKGAVTAPEVFGRVQLVRGDYDFAGKRFTLTRGDLRFQGGYPPDPLIDITATTTQSGFSAQLDIDGTALRPSIAFSSVPSLPEDEVLSRVLFGTAVTDLSAPEAVQLATALASLRGGGGGFNPINAVRKGLGIDRLRILPADAARRRGTAVAAGQYIGRSVYLELATDAAGYTATNIEVSLTRSLSILSEIATLGGQSVNVRLKRDY